MKKSPKRSSQLLLKSTRHQPSWKVAHFLRIGHYQTWKCLSIFGCNSELGKELIELGRAIVNRDARVLLKITRGIKRWLGSTLELDDPLLLEKIKAKQDPEQLEAKLLSMNEVRLALLLLCGITHYRFAKYEEAKTCFLQVIELYEKVNNRNIGFLNSQAFHYLFLVYEKQIQGIELRPALLNAYRSACLRKDNISQATLINLILRNYIGYKDVEEAAQFIERTVFPEGTQNSQHCRYLYYTGLVKAVCLEYFEASGRLNQALKIAPEQKALGFKITVQKLALVVDLLQGNIPERSLFMQDQTSSYYRPYFLLVQSVRHGDLKQFNEVSSRYKNTFSQDRLESLISR